MQGIFSSDGANTSAVTATGTSGATAIKATSDGTTVVQATSDAHTARLGGTNGGIGVIGRSLQGGIGVLADSKSGTAVNATSQSGVAVLAQSDSNFGVLGQATGYSFGVVGKAANAGVAAFNPNNQHAAYLASDCCAAWLTGDVHVTGKLSKGGGGFTIDHPMEPATKFLSHSFVESPDMKNVYDGVALADANGEATVELPAWFEVVNRDLRYQLTPLGAAAPNLHAAREVEGNRFHIAGAKPGMRVSWQVTGIRKDAWANAHRIVVEEEKDARERAHFLHPELHGADASRASRRSGTLGRSGREREHRAVPAKHAFLAARRRLNRVATAARSRGPGARALLVLERVEPRRRAGGAASPPRYAAAWRRRDPS